MHPFKTEWCLSIIRKIVFKNTKKRFNPFRAGRCLSTGGLMFGLGQAVRSQSLSSRAMSFDVTDEINFFEE